jgi:hypothetical protein
MYFKGYAEKTSYGWFEPGDFHAHGAHPQHAKKAFAGDSVTHISSAMQKARDNLVEGKSSQPPAQANAEPPAQRDPSDMGSLGSSIFMRELDYCDYNNLFVVPIAHAGLCGVVKDFWKAVLGGGSRDHAISWPPGPRM